MCWVNSLLANCYKFVSTYVHSVSWERFPNTDKSHPPNSLLQPWLTTAPPPTNSTETRHWTSWHTSTPQKASSQLSCMTSVKRASGNQIHPQTPVGNYIPHCDGNEQKDRDIWLWGDWGAQQTEGKPDDFPAEWWRQPQAIWWAFTNNTCLYRYIVYFYVQSNCKFA